MEFLVKEKLETWVEHNIWYLNRISTLSKSNDEYPVSLIIIPHDTNDKMSESLKIIAHSRISKIGKTKFSFDRIRSVFSFWFITLSAQNIVKNSPAFHKLIEWENSQIGYFAWTWMYKIERRKKKFKTLKN